MVRIVLTAHAHEDLIRLRGFLAEESEVYASKAIRTLTTSIDHLALFPEMGKEVPQLKGMRIFHKPYGKAGYRIYYRWLPQSEKILILKIQHHKEA
ncbi:MAG: type II toxin-antitoxin system RelE/ParE family toxin [Hydrogenovibrio sp.]|uniref:type II toxin-antitoxin system RelE/ParE family toxin n=1 Tax=Hydrogenovibrio sp. TaxID=2065821 RepID=UPI0028703B7A|nr:type II toxin-antitoxin system RelE/ParE family toxin [Hydrogenovibrio sp.]MDR9498846.1 type II toxin-antitoxin system RelE/ParE family toxin [Hydrogenovibrio sp.]